MIIVLWNCSCKNQRNADKLSIRNMNTQREKAVLYCPVVFHVLNILEFISLLMMFLLFLIIMNNVMNTEVQVFYMDICFHFCLYWMELGHLVT